METGRRCWMPVPGAGASAVSWQCAWRRLGDRVPGAGAPVLGAAARF